MKHEQNPAPDTTTSMGDLSGVRRRNDGGIDIDYYHCLARQLRALYMKELLGQFIRFLRGHSVRCELKQSDE